MKKMNKTPAMVAAMMMLLCALICFIPRLGGLWYNIQNRDWYSLIVTIFLLFITRVIYSVGLFLGKKDITGAVMVGGSGVLYFLVVGIYVLTLGSAPQFLTILHLVVYALLLFITLDVVKLPKPVGTLLITVPAALLLILTVVQDIRLHFFLGGHFSSRFFMYNPDLCLRLFLEDILVGGSLITAGIAVSTEPKEKTAPQSQYDQAPYQFAPQAQQYQQVPQYQAPQYQQPVYTQPQQAPQYQQVPQYQAWATEDYHKTGYAEMLDVYMTGLYYSFITKDDVDKATGVVGQRSEAGMDNSLTYCYSVEGGAEIAKEITRGVVPVIGSIYVEQYLGDFTPFGPAVTQALKSTDGVMIFDIVHLNKHKLWDELEAAMKAANN